MFDQSIIDIFKKGGVVIARTDTIYGLLTSASNEQSVERVYQLKQRTPDKSPIVLISDISQIYDKYEPAVYEVLSRYWPGPNSIILPSANGPGWITRGNASIAYRLPASEALRQLISQTGPLAAPSANPEGLPPAHNLDEAKAYFGDQVDAYVDAGDSRDAQPSSLYRLSGSQLEQLR